MTTHSELSAKRSLEKNQARRVLLSAAAVLNATELAVDLNPDFEAEARLDELEAIVDEAAGQLAEFLGYRHHTQLS